MTYKVVKLKDDVLVYDINTPDSKHEFMDNIDARPGDTFRFTYNGWLQYVGNDYDNMMNNVSEDHEARQILTQVMNK